MVERRSKEGQQQILKETELQGEGGRTPRESVKTTSQRDPDDTAKGKNGEDLYESGDNRDFGEPFIQGQGGGMNESD